MSDVLLQTKFFQPASPPSLVSRSHLINRLSDGLGIGTQGFDARLTLVSAPAGFGKTTLVSAWLAQLAARPAQLSPVMAAWLSLDENDNDPVRFLTYLIAALQVVRPELGQTAVALLQSPQSPAPEAVLTVVINELAAVPTLTVLILDDYHLISTPAIHQAVTFLLEHQPPSLHLVISCRADPLLPLARWRARRQLVELHAADLRFTVAEAAVFLNDAMGLELTTGDVAALEARTEGWIAGLQLAGLALQGRGQQPGGANNSQFIQAFTGSHRHVVSYLVEEVLNQRPQGTMDFLLQTSILDPLSSSLCDYVLGEANVQRSDHGRAPFGAQGAPLDSQSILEKLEQANLFIVPLDEEGKWYRYHHLFAEVLRARLQKVHPGQVRALHVRASAWYEQATLIPEAVRHALEAEAWEHAARLIEQNALLFGFKGQIHLVLGWLVALPETVVRSHPMLCIFYAGALMHISRLQDAEARLQDAERSTPPDAPAEQGRLVLGRVAMQRSNLVRIQGDIDGSVAHARRALDLLPETDSASRASAGLNLAYQFLVSGNVKPESERLLTAALASVRALGNAVAVLRGTTLLARLCVLQGRLCRSAELYQEAATTLTVPEGATLFIGTPAHFFGLGDLKREWNQLDEAEKLLVQGTIQARQQIFDGDVIMLGYQSLARLKQARGDTEGARATLAEFRQLAQQHDFFDGLLANARAVQAWFDLAAGDISAAAQWAKTRGIQIGDEITFPQEREYLTLARLFIRMGSASDNPENGSVPKALQLLERLRATARAAGRVGSLIEILCLHALAFEVLGDQGQAKQSIEQAITMARPEGYVRTFLDEGEPLRRLLYQVWSKHKNYPTFDEPSLAYVEMLLGAFDAEGSPGHSPGAEQGVPASSAVTTNPLLEPLNKREIEMLSLIAEGLTNREIADRWVVAQSTVKWYINNLYGKLGAKSRTHALVRAHELHLL